MSHPKNKEYVRKWRLTHREDYLEQTKRSVYKLYFYRQGVKELMRIDPSLFY